MDTADPHPADETPPCLESPEAWSELLERVGPAWLLVAIGSRMSAALKRRMPPEDILQEALLHAWRDRHQLEWRGLRPFRAWLLEIVDHRIRDASLREGSLKRGAGRPTVAFSALLSGESSQGPLPGVSTTPGRLAVYREQAAAMRAALEALPAGLGEVVRLRLFEELPMKEVAARLGLSLSTAKHRFRKGAERYHHRLRVELASRSREAREKR